MASNTGVKLLSSIRKTRSRSVLNEIPDTFFDEGEEREAFLWMKDYVKTYGTWPTASTFKHETGVRIVLCGEPLQYYLNDARQKALWQMMFEPFAEIRKKMQSQQPDEALEIMRQCIAASSEFNHRRSGLITLAQALELVREDYEIAKHTVGLRGIPTGFDYLDEVTDGLQNSDLISVIARTGRGKTYFLLKMAYAANQAGYSVLFLSMEMGALQLARRYFGLGTGVDPTFIRRGRLSTVSEREMRRQLDAMGEVEAPFWWLAGNFKKTVPALRAAVHEANPDLIIADSSYLLTPEKTGKASSRRETIADVIEQLGGLSKEADRPLVQSTQFNRQATKPKKGEDDEARHNPVAHLTMEKIGETDVIGQSSSIAIGLEKGDPPHEDDERYAGLMKGREGESGWFKYHYKFRPVNMSQICDHRSVRREEREERPAPPDLSYMEAAA